MLLLCALIAGSSSAWAADKWVKTAPADLKSGDVVVLVDLTSKKAMSNDKGTSSAPAATDVTLNDDNSEITSDVAEAIQWTVTKDGDSYQFGVGESYLYCTNTNNGVRVGSNANNVFTVTTGGDNGGYYLVNTATSRYVGCYNTSDWRCYTSINANIKGNNNAFYKKSTGGSAATPSIVSDDVELAYDATSGSISYSVTNPVEGGVLKAAITAGNEGSWLSLGAVSTSIPLTCSANKAFADRKATVTLTYTYNTSETVTKTISVTQAGNPNSVDNISDINAVDKTYQVQGTVVATSNKGFVIGDGTGYVYTYLNAVPTVAVGDKVLISGKTGTYGHIIQFTNTATITEAASSNYAGTPAAKTVDATAMAAYNADYQMSDYVQFEGALAKNGSNYEITVGTATARISYPSEAQQTTLNNYLSKTVRIKGYFAGFSSSTFTVMLESVSELAVPTINASNVTIEADATSGSIEYKITNPTDATLTAAVAADCDWISNILVDADAEKVTFTTSVNTGAKRTTTITLSYTGAENKAVTVTQNAIAYASLPFAFEGGIADIETTPGLTQTGLGTDYGSAPKLKFNDKDDELVLRINDVPGALYFDIKGNSFSGGTFKVQTSMDGTEYEDLATYTELGATQTELFNLLPSVRYIKWVYTNKDAGNVGLGNINLIKENGVKIGDAGYTTFWSMKAYNFTGLTAYVVSEINANSVTLTEVTSAPAWTGVILKGDAGIYALEETDSPAEVGTNLLQTSRGGNRGGESASYDLFALAKKGDVVGFYKVKDGVTIPAYKCFLSIKKEASAPEYLAFILGGETTNIADVRSKMEDVKGEVYDLLGRRVAQPTKGLYIVNGKKVVLH